MIASAPVIVGVFVVAALVAFGAIAAIVVGFITWEAAARRDYKQKAARHAAEVCSTCGTWLFDDRGVWSGERWTRTCSVCGTKWDVDREGMPIGEPRKPGERPAPAPDRIGSARP